MENIKPIKLYHCTFTLGYPFAVVTNYRQKCLSAARIDRIKEMIGDLAEGYGRLVEITGEADHIPFRAELNPKAAPSVIANHWKTVTRRLWRRDFGDILAQTYRKPVRWSRRYFVASCGGAPLSVIKQYIEQQARPEEEARIPGLTAQRAPSPSKSDGVA